MSHARDRTEHDWVEEDTTGFDNHCRWCYHCSQTISTFFAFPWGRESFLKTISCMKPPKFLKKKKCDDPVGTLILKLKQDTFRLQGFPLSLQLVAFRAIPQLLSYIPAPTDQKALMDMEDRHLPQHLSINSEDMFRVEFATDVSQ